MSLRSGELFGWWKSKSKLRKRRNFMLFYEKQSSECAFLVRNTILLIYVFCDWVISAVTTAEWHCWEVTWDHISFPFKINFLWSFYFNYSLFSASETGYKSLSVQTRSLRLHGLSLQEWTNILIWRKFKYLELQNEDFNGKKKIATVEQ